MKEKPCYDRGYVNDYSGTVSICSRSAFPAVLYTCSLGSNLGNYLFIWRLPHGVTLEAATNENVHEIKKSGGSMRWQPIHLRSCVFESDTDTYIYMNLDDVLRMCIQLHIVL